MPTLCFHRERKSVFKLLKQWHWLFYSNLSYEFSKNVHSWVTEFFDGIYVYTG